MKRNNFSITIKILGGSGCGSVGKTVASDTRGLRFESSHRQNLYWTLFTDNWKNENKEKEAVNGPFWKKQSKYLEKCFIIFDNPILLKLFS